MKRIILSLTMGLLVSLLASENFENKHLKCTLTEKNGEQISERQAESLNEFKVDVLLSKTDLKVGYKTFKYKNTESGNDIYSYHIYGDDYYNSYIDYNNTFYIKRIVTTIYKEKKYQSAYENLVNKYENDDIERVKEQDKEREKEQSEYSCTEATFIEKAKYKYKNF